MKLNHFLFINCTIFSIMIGILHCKASEKDIATSIISIEQGGHEVFNETFSYNSKVTSLTAKLSGADADYLNINLNNWKQQSISNTITTKYVISVNENAPIRVLTFDLIFDIEFDGGLGSITRKDQKIKVIKQGYGLEANFKADFTYVNTPATINFTDLTSGIISNHTWDFGDGTSSNETNPSHTFNEPRDYTITLTVSNEYDTSTVIKTNYIKVKDNVEVTSSIFADKEAALSSDTINFQAYVIGPATEKVWEFGDGTIIVGQNNVSHTFTSAGKYNVKFICKGGNQSDTSYISITIAKENWSYHPNSEYFIPVLALGNNDILHFVDNNKIIHAIDKSGNLKWQFDLNESNSYGTSDICIDNNGILYVKNGINLYAINSDGTLKWKSKSIGTDNISLSGDGHIYTSANFRLNGIDKKTILYCFNSNGLMEWELEVAQSLNTLSKSIGKEGVIYVAEWESGILHAVNPNGTKKWQFQSDGSMPHAPTIAKDGTIYFLTFGGEKEYVYAVNNDGSLKWKNEINEFGGFGGNPVIDLDGNIYFSWGDIYSYFPNGELKWKWDPGFGGCSPLVLGNDNLIYFANNKNIITLNLDGTLNWSISKEEGVYITSLLIKKNGDAYFAENHGNIFSINIGCDGLMNSIWPCEGASFQRTFDVSDKITINKNFSFKKLKGMFNVYPNPNIGKLMVRFENANSGKYQVLIINELGQLLHEKEIYLTESTNEEEIELSHLPKGIYYVRISDSETSNTQKVILQ